MTRHDCLRRILDSGLVAVMRARSGEQLADVAQALVAGGVDVMEVTFTVPDALDVLRQVRERLGDRVVLGAGTVLDPETARTAMLAGAQFVVAPTVNLDVIRLCRRYSTPILPGAFTPTEVLAAWEAGADIVKVFPSDIGGARYFKALRGPLPHVQMMPTGGVDLETAADFLRAGACALGVGSSLVSATAMASGDMQSIEATARRFVEIVQETRAELAD